MFVQGKVPHLHKTDKRMLKKGEEGSLSPTQGVIKYSLLDTGLQKLRKRVIPRQFLAPMDFSGAVFTCAHFQNIAQTSSLCEFHYKSTKGNPSLMRCRLLIITTNLVHADFCQT